MLRRKRPFEDLEHYGNSCFYHTGHRCETEGCERVAGTFWSARWCSRCNIQRTRQLKLILMRLTRIHSEIALILQNNLPPHLRKAIGNRGP